MVHKLLKEYITIHIYKHNTPYTCTAMDMVYLGVYTNFRSVSYSGKHHLFIDLELMLGLRNSGISSGGFVDSFFFSAALLIYPKNDCFLSDASRNEPGAEDRLKDCTPVAMSVITQSSSFTRSGLVTVPQMICVSGLVISCM